MTLVDTAGLRDGAELVEQEGIRARTARGGRASLAFVVLDRSRPFERAIVRRSTDRRGVDADGGREQGGSAEAWTTEEADGRDRRCRR